MTDFSLWVIVAVPALIAGVLAMFMATLRRHNLAGMREAGIATLQILRSLIMNIQRHRGVSACVLSGNLSFRAELEQAQESVSRDITNLTQQSEWLRDNQHWQAVTAHWARLAGQYQRLDIRQSIDQHNRLVNNLLVMAADAAAAHAISSSRGDACHWHKYLCLAEKVGQLRALGVAYLGGIECGNPSSRLRSMLSEQLAQVQSEMASGSMYEELNVSELTAVTAFVNDWPKAAIQSKSTPAFSQADYFLAATDVMELLYQQIDKILQNSMRE